MSLGLPSSLVISDIGADENSGSRNINQTSSFGIVTCINAYSVIASVTIS